MEQREKATDVQSCEGAQTEKAEPGAAGELCFCQPSSLKVIQWGDDTSTEAAVICLAQEGHVLFVHWKLLVIRNTFPSLSGLSG